MGKKIYVPGNILVKTPFFRWKESVCLIKECPNGFDILECNKVMDGHPVFEITEDSAPSIYNEYYAERDFVSIAEYDSIYFWGDPGTCYKTFDSTMKEIEALIQDPHISTSSILYRQLCISLVAALETYICDTFIVGAVNERRILLKLLLSGVYNMNSRKDRDNLIDLVDMWNDNKCCSAEINAIWSIRRYTFSNLERIRNLYKEIYDITIGKSEKIENVINTRHLLAHRNGYKKDGSIIEISSSELMEWVYAIREFVLKIHGSMLNWWSEFTKAK